MEEVLKILEVSELRENNVQPEKIAFKRKIIGGFNSKEVFDHIQFMNDRLYNAEISFKNQLDEYNTMVVMLTQERDKCIEELQQAESLQRDLEHKLCAFKKENTALSAENDLLNNKLLEQVRWKDEYQKLHKQAAEQRQLLTDCEMTNTMLADSSKQLEITLEQLKEELNNVKCGVKLEEYERVVHEYELLQNQYNEVMSEKDLIIVEKNDILEQSKMTAENLNKLFEKNKDLWNKNTRQSLEIRKLISVFETKTHEVSHSHMRNMDQIRNNIKSILDALDNEGTNITTLIRSPYENLSQSDEYEDDHTSASVPVICTQC